MNAAESKRKPALLKQNDIISFYHIQMPRWLFADKRYKHISLEVKVAYSLLLNRHQLSKLNRWVNEAGEVYVVFSRNELAAELRVSLRKAVCVFKELSDAGLVWETRRGHNKTNLIYLTRVELSDADAAEYDSAPFKSSPVVDAEVESGDANSALPEEEQEAKTIDTTDEETDDSGHCPPLPVMQILHLMKCRICTGVIYTRVILKIVILIVSQSVGRSRTPAHAREKSGATDGRRNSRT